MKTTMSIGVQLSTLKYVFNNTVPVLTTESSHTEETGEVEDDEKFEGVGKTPLYVILIIIILVENSLVIGAAYMRKKKSIPDVLIISLALSAVVNALTVMAMMVYIISVLRRPVRNCIGLCLAQYWFACSQRQFDILVITLIGLDRYFAICRPLLYRTRLKVKHGVFSVLGVWILSALITCLPFFGVGKVSLALKTLCVMDWGSPSAVPVVFLTYVQFFVVLFCYLSIFRTIRSLVHRQKEIERSQNPTYKKEPGRKKSKVFRKEKGEGGNCDPPSPTHSIRSVQTVQSYLLTPSPTHDCKNNNFQFETGAVTNTRLAWLGQNGSSGGRRLSCSDISCRNGGSSTLGAITEETLWPDDDKQVSVNSVNEPDTEISPSGRSPKGGRKKEKTRKLSEMGLINPALEEEDCIEKRDKPREKQLVDDVAAENTKQLTVPDLSSAMPIRSTIKRSISLPNVLDEDDPTGTLGKQGRYRPTRTSSPNLKPTLTKQLSSLRDRWKQVILKRSTSQMKRSWRESRHFANIMGIVVVIFYITWLPMAIQITLWLIMGPTPFILRWELYAMNMTLASPLLIPVVYGLMCKPYQHNYRRILYKVFCIKFFTKVCLKKESVGVTDDSFDSSKF